MSGTTHRERRIEKSVISKDTTECSAVWCLIPNDPNKNSFLFFFSVSYSFLSFYLPFGPQTDKREAEKAATEIVYINWVRPTSKVRLFQAHTRMAWRMLLLIITYAHRAMHRFVFVVFFRFWILRNGKWIWRWTEFSNKTQFLFSVGVFSLLWTRSN